MNPKSFINNDGFEIGKKVPIKVRVEKRGDGVNGGLLRRSVVRSKLFCNSGVTTGIAFSQVAFKCLTPATDYPVNDGSFRNLKVIMPMGRVIVALSGHHPCACG